MPQQCTICNHPDRLQIEAALVRGVSLRNVAKQYEASQAAVYRHRQKCMKVALVAARKEQADQEELELEQSGYNAFAEMLWLRAETRKLYREVRGSDQPHIVQNADDDKGVGDPRLALAALGEMRKQTQLFGELLKGVEENKQSERESEWLAIREAIFIALEPFPDARLEVAQALLVLQEQEGATNGRFTGD